MSTRITPCPIKIVAFMQNPWFPIGTSPRHIKMYNESQHFHRRVLALSMSGRRLLSAFGEHLYNQIWWDNASPIAATIATGKFEADMEHMMRATILQMPRLLLGFGTSANDAITTLLTENPFPYQIRFMACHHPNARGRTQQDLNDFAQVVKNFMEAES